VAIDILNASHSKRRGKQSPPPQTWLMSVPNRRPRMVSARPRQLNCTSVIADSEELQVAPHLHRDVVSSLAPVARSAQQLDVVHRVGSAPAPRNHVVMVQILG
jgi:hypothetical protein